MRALEALSQQAARMHEDLSTVRAAYFEAKEMSENQMRRVARLEAELRDGAGQIALLQSQLDAEKSATAHAIERSVETES